MAFSHFRLVYLDPDLASVTNIDTHRDERFDIMPPNRINCKKKERKKKKNKKNVVKEYRKMCHNFYLFLACRLRFVLFSSYRNRSTRQAGRFDI